MTKKKDTISPEVRERVRRSLENSPFTALMKKHQTMHEELKAKHGPDYDKPAATFSLNKAEQAVVDEWLKSLHPEILAIQKKQRGNDSSYSFVGEDEAYYGAIGGGVTYSFIPTGLGHIITVKETTTGKELNVNDALDWFFFG